MWGVGEGWDMGGFRCTANSLKEYEVIMILPYIVKYDLQRIYVPYFSIRIWGSISSGRNDLW